MTPAGSTRTKKNHPHGPEKRSSIGVLLLSGNSAATAAQVAGVNEGTAYRVLSNLRKFGQVEVPEDQRPRRGRPRKNASARRNNLPPMQQRAAFLKGWTTPELSRRDGDLQSTLHIVPKLMPMVTETMSRYDSSHDMSHLARVVKLSANLFASELGRDPVSTLDASAVLLAAVLHDINDDKYISDAHPACPLTTLLQEHGVPTARAHKVEAIVEAVSYSKEIKDPEQMRRIVALHPELGIVQDADRLDALGAVGIGRAFTYAASNAERRRTEQGEHADGTSGPVKSSMRDTIEHFDDKLLKLEGMMKTEAGRRVAKDRANKLRTFAAWWAEEATF